MVTSGKWQVSAAGPGTDPSYDYRIGIGLGSVFVAPHVPSVFSPWITKLSAHISKFSAQR